MITPSPYLMPTYNRLPIALSHGQGCRVWDTEGHEYLDALSGIAVNTLGHNHAGLVAALRDQVGRLIHTSNLYHVPLQDQLAEKLVRLSGMQRAFFCNSGLEANEAALKLARLQGQARGRGPAKVIVFEGAFHGRSIATLSATASAKVQKGFEPLVEGFVRLPLNDLAALEQAILEDASISAVFLESIQGEGGIREAHLDFLRGLRALCSQHNVLLMLDEVQCGIGRTGRWFAHQWAEILPDVMPLAKGLGSGVPIGAVLTHGPAADLFTPGSHGTTFGGNPLAMRAGLATIAAIEAEGLLANASARGDQLIQGLKRRLTGLNGVVEVRGRGLMVGVELHKPCADLVKYGLERGVLFNVTAERVVRLLPALIITSEEIDEIIETVGDLIAAFASTNE